MRLGLIVCLLIVLLPTPPPLRLLTTRRTDDLLLTAATTWQWPVTGPVLRRFDPPPRPWLPGHRGVDLAAPEGTEVLAAGAGTIWFAGTVATRPVISIAHPNGTRTTYEPVHPIVSTGDTVATGDPIGRLLPGHPGCATVCLHWGLRRDDTYLDPLSLVGQARVRLLPINPRRPRHRPFRLLRPIPAHL